MPIITDLHLHSKYARACSKDLDIDNLEKYARIKGVDMLGSADFTHPKWIQELKSKLTENTTGQKGVHETTSGFKFLLTTELSFIYTQDGKGRKVHLVILAPNFGVVDQITEQMLKHGRVDYDGRPIFGISCIQFLEEMKAISRDIEIIPAHIWTPWFSMFGSNSGFDTVKQCFGEYTKHIHALETGLSSDPPMNWRLSQLDKYNLVSFSDSHSFWPWRMGREATLFDFTPDTVTYEKLVQALRTGDKLHSTIEVDPNYGKYHLDGHRNCNICMEPKESIKHKKICPQCKKPLTIGVLHRVEELADREEGFKLANTKPFKTLLPLSELISKVLGKGLATKTVSQAFEKLLQKGTSEYNILLNLPEKDLAEATDPAIVSAILNNRKGTVEVQPGYDGEYGIPLFGDKAQEVKPLKPIPQPQKSLSEF